MWDLIALTSLEETVIAALHIIAPEIERLSFKVVDETFPGRAPFIKVKEVDEPVSLRSLGDGVNRLFGIAMALVTAKDGLFLVDEIENGIHYSVQPDVWRLIFQVAQRLNVQVFATTHSWDCIVAFHQAADENKEEEGMLICLDRKGDKIRVVELGEREVGIAVKGQIEIR